MMGKNVLVLGSGAREHALAWKLQQSNLVKRVFIAPGNACSYTARDCANFGTVEGVRDFCIRNAISLLVIGPEKEICAGWAESLSDICAVFAPSASCACLEGSKSFAKNFMIKNGLPTAEFKSFNCVTDAIDFVNSVTWQRIVIKKDGLCAGKGVSICDSKSDAVERVSRAFADSPAEFVVVEEFLDGFEVSAMCFSDGTTISRIPLSQDHKRALENDLGENTGGMGAIAPIVVAKDVDNEITRILQTTIDAMKRRGTPYKGILYAGLIITASGPKLLEYNCRFGDPETEVIMRLLESDLYAIMQACIDGKLAELLPQWSKKFAIGIVIASAGYPSVFPTGLPITNVPTDNDYTVTFYAGVKRAESGEIVNSGGRVLCVTSIGTTPFSAKSACLNAIDTVQFSIKHFRRDIGDFLLKPREMLSYSKSGVNISEGNAFVEEIKPFCKRTLTAGTEQIGGFGAVIDLKAAGFDASVQLIVGMDGVGTKLELADRVQNYSSLGFDLVGMCANDVLCHAAQPLAFLDYYVTGRLERVKAVAVIKSVANACLEANCALIGGETAEMPGVYTPKQWDIAGCCIGARKAHWPQLPLMDKISPGDRLIALESNGLHSNGFSLVRRIITDSGVSMQDACPWKSCTLASEFLKPTKIYVNALLDLAISGDVLAMAHITGGGIIENLPRVLPKHLTARVNCASWNPPALFKWLRSVASLSTYEMLKTFNCGIGMIIIVPATSSSSVCRALSKLDTKFYEIGDIIQRTSEGSQIELRNSENLFPYYFEPNFVHQRRINVAILISGTGSNMVELIKSSRKRESCCYISIVLSNRSDAAGLDTARSLGVDTLIVPSQGRSRQEFEADMSKELEVRRIDLICLAGFMRLLTGEFTEKWPNRILNVHPSLLPSFKGAHAVRLALEAGVKVTGCTVHYVVEGVDSGKILGQTAICIDDDDDENSVHKKIQFEEHRLFPAMMQDEAKKIIKSESNERQN